MWDNRIQAASSRSKTRLTCEACHLPPLAVGAPEALGASAVSLRVFPCALKGCTAMATLSVLAFGFGVFEMGEGELQRP